jgi:hypothetical protein
LPRESAPEACLQIETSGAQHPIDASRPIGMAFGPNGDCPVCRYPATMKSAHLLCIHPAGDAHPDLARKTDICGKVLAGARRLSDASRFGAPLVQLASRAGELLDDMDEILVALDPVANGPSFAIAARLHRELEHIQAAIAERRRDADPASKVAHQR